MFGSDIAGTLGAMPYYVDSHRHQRLASHPVLDVKQPFLGFGWNWFDHLGSGGLYGGDALYRMDREVLPAMENVAAWDALGRELDVLRPGYFRFGLPPDVHCDAEGRFVGGTRHIERLRWLGRWAMRNGATVLIDTFTIPAAHEFPAHRKPGASHCNMAARDNEAYARRFVAPMMRHLVEELGLECVRMFNPVNEGLQYGVYQTPPGGPDAYVHYVEMFREMRRALDAVGLTRDRVGLTGCDCLAERDLFLYEFQARKLDIDPYVESYSAHYYNLRFDTLPPGDGSWTSPIQDVIRRAESWQRYLSSRGKPLHINEISTFHYGWRENNPSGAASADTCLTVSEAVMRLVAQGARCFAVWQLFDSNENDGWWNALEFGDDGRWHRQGHKHAMYGMLARALRPGSSFHALRADPHTNLSALHGLCVVNPDGTRRILLSNHDPVHNFQAEIALPESFAGATFQATVSDRVRLAARVPEAFAADGSTLQVTVPAFSLMSLEEGGPGRA